MVKKFFPNYRESVCYVHQGYKEERKSLCYGHTANIFTAKTTGFHCVTSPTAVSLHFLQTTNANIERKNCKKIFTVGCLY